MKGIHNDTISISKEYNIYAEDDRKGRLERATVETYRLYRQDTPLWRPLLDHFRPELHNTVKWIFTCLEYVDEFRNSELLDELKMHHKSLRLALDRIDKMTAPDLKSKAVKFVAENAQPGHQVVACRYDLHHERFFAGILLGKMHEVDLGSGNESLWDAGLLARGLKPFAPFYDHVDNLQRLGKLVKPTPFTRDTPTREGCLKTENPLEAVAPEIKYNLEVTRYNAILKKEQNAVFAAIGAPELSKGRLIHPWFNNVTARGLLKPPLLKIMKLNAENDDTWYQDIVKGCATLYADPEKYSDVLYKYTAAGLDFPLPEVDFLAQLRVYANTPDAPLLVCREKFASTYMLARSAVEHYSNQTRLIKDDILQNNFTQHSAQALQQRLQLTGQYHDQAFKVLRDLRHAIRLPLTEDDHLDICEIKALYLEFGHESLKKTVPMLKRETSTVCAPDIFGKDTGTVSVRQSVPNTSQWMMEAMNTSTLVRKETALLPTRPEPRRYSGFPDGMAVRRQIESQYEAVGYPRGVPERPHSMLVQTLSPETTLPPRAASSGI